MSRSHRKVYGYCDRNPYAKRLANKRVRRTKHLPNGKLYKKVFDSWDICDYTITYSRQEIIFNARREFAKGNLSRRKTFNSVEQYISHELYKMRKK